MVAGANRSALTEVGLCCPKRDPIQYAPSPIISPMVSNRIARLLPACRAIRNSFAAKGSPAALDFLKVIATSSWLLRSRQGYLFQLFDQILYLPLRFLEGARAVNHVIGQAALFLHRELRGDALLRLIRRKPSFFKPRKLLLGAAPAGDDPVQFLIVL